MFVATTSCMQINLHLFNTLHAHTHTHTHTQALEAENKRVLQEKGDLEVKLRTTDESTVAESDLLTLKAAKRELEARVEALEDELDEANSRADSVQQGKARLELANQTLRQQHQKELETREEEMERTKAAMNTKVCWELV